MLFRLKSISTSRAGRLRIGDSKKCVLGAYLTLESLWLRVEPGHDLSLLHLNWILAGPNKSNK